MMNPISFEVSFMPSTKEDISQVESVLSQAGFEYRLAAFDTDIMPSPKFIVLVSSFDDILAVVTILKHHSKEVESKPSSPC
jgi:hypothetical protein